MKSKYLIFALIVAVLAPALLMSAVQAQTTYYAQTVAWYEEYGYFADVIDPNNGRYAHDNVSLEKQLDVIGLKSTRTTEGMHMTTLTLR